MNKSESEKLDQLSAQATRVNSALFDDNGKPGLLTAVRKLSMQMNWLMRLLAVIGGVIAGKSTGALDAIIKLLGSVG